VARSGSVAARAARGVLLVGALGALVGCSSGSGAAPSTPTGPSPSAEPSMTASVPAQPSAGSSAAVTTSNPPVGSSPSTAPFLIGSSAFAEGQPIPAEFSCHGADRSPPLSWSGVPAGAKALVLFVDDPDGRNWVHWSVLDLAPTSDGLPAGVSPSADSPQQGRNDFGKMGYGGPCPPSGTHHYHFTLSALAAPLGLPGHPDGAAVRVALGHADVLARVTLIGTFKA
jgi:Raf kinase inhibitor-like YbhB/YbcL family protein